MDGGSADIAGANICRPMDGGSAENAGSSFQPAHPWT